MSRLKHLMTVKKLSATTGISESFIWYLLGEGRLTTYKINSSTLVSLIEFESIARPMQRGDVQRMLELKARGKLPNDLVLLPLCIGESI